MSNKRDQIILATRDLVFEQGLQGVSMSQIAQRAEVGMGTIYNYFPSKEELVFTLYDAIKAAMSEYALEGYDEGQPIVTRFLHLLTSYAQYGIHHPREFFLSEQLGLVPFVQSQAKPYPVTSVVQRLFTEAKQQRLVKEIPDNVMTLLIFGALSTLVEAHAAQQIQLNDELIEQSAAACWDAIKR